MAKVLKKILLTISKEQDNLCILENPPAHQKILLKTRDKKAESRYSSYSFIDKITTQKGIVFIWNSYKNCSELIRVSVMDNGNFLLKLPKNLLIDAAYC